MKKILLLLVMVIAVSGAQAKRERLYASFGTPDVNAIYGGTYTWSATSNNLMPMFEFSNGELANYSTLKFSIVNCTGGQVRVGYYEGPSWTELGKFASDGEKTIDLTTLGDTRSKITKISFGGRDGTGSGSVNIAANGVYLVPSSSGDNLYATFQNPASNASYKGTNKFTWVGNTNTLMDIFTFANGELANYSTLNFKFSDITSGKGVQIVFVYSDETTSYTQYYTAGIKNLAISDLLATGKTAEDVTKIRFGGHSYGGTCTIDVLDFYLEKAEEYEAMDIITTITSSSDKDAPFVWSATGTLSDISNNLGKDNSSVIFGYADNNDDAHGSFNVTGYDNVTLNLSEFICGKNPSVRLLKGTGTSNVEFTTVLGTLSYTTTPLTLTTCASIMAGDGASNCQKVSSIVFKKEFKPSSTTDFSIAASTSSTISYDRAFTANQASTVCFPFALTQDECNAAGVFYELTDFDGTTLTFTEVTSGGTTAYKPYLFKATATGAPFSDLTARAITASSEATTSYTTADNNGYTATMTGTLAKQSVNGKYGWNSVGGAFSKATSNEVTIDAFRAYITLNGVPHARVAARFVGDNVTGINEVKSQKAEENDVLYSPSGQRVSADYKGIVIKNGRKYFKK